MTLVKTFKVTVVEKTHPPTPEEPALGQVISGNNPLDKLCLRRFRKL